MPLYMLLHSTITSTALKSLLRKGHILFGGNRRLKIYGTLRCASGRRMKMANRVFFATEQEAVDAGYRPCGHCIKNAYTQWKKQNT